MSDLRVAMSTWFAPPRPHGELIEHRRVGFVELFYDLAFVVLISQIAHVVGGHPSWHALWGYAVVFALGWFAWLNGTQYEDLHGRSDGRSRLYIFTQMGFLALLAVNAGAAPTDRTAGTYFAITYALLLLFLSYQWWRVMGVDAPSFRPVVRRYVGILLGLAAVMTGSIAISNPEVRLLAWSAATVAALLANIAIFLRAPVEMNSGVEAEPAVTESGAERFGLYTIIVLGESILGVVNGMVASDRSWIVIATGMFALALGAGMWWCYFDFVGMRIASGSRARTAWFFLHLPLSAAIAAVGAAMLGLVTSASEPRTATDVAWLMGGSLAAVLICLALLLLALPRVPGERWLPLSLVAAAAYCLAIAALTPPPWAFSLLLLVGLQAVWVLAFWWSAQHRRLVDGTQIPDSAFR